MQMLLGASFVREGIQPTSSIQVTSRSRHLSDSDVAVTFEVTRGQELHEVKWVDVR